MPHHAYNAIIDSPIGKLGIQLHDHKLTHLIFLPKNTKNQAPTDAIAQTIQTQLTQYFQNPLHRFKIAFDLIGTTFQKSVWKKLSEIPNGTTVTYGMLAKQLQTSPRAVGNACRTNPIPIIIPCHRVLAMNHIGGYAGKTDGNMLDIKQWLLQHESHSKTD